MEERSGLLICIIVVCLPFSQVITAAPVIIRTDNSESSQRDFVKVGNKWHAYVLATTYDIARTIIYKNPVGLRPAPRSISELTQTIPRTIHHRYPCQHLLITEPEQLLEYQHYRKGVPIL